MPNCTLSEIEIVEGLRSQDAIVSQRTQNALYLDDAVNASVKGYVQNRSGTWEQAHQVFDYAFLHFDRRVRDGRYPSPNHLENNWRKTLCGIGYNAWNFKDYGQNDPRPFDVLPDNYNPIAPISEDDLNMLQIDHILETLDQCGPTCRFIFEQEIEGYNAKEIAESLTRLLGKPISHENARTQKYNCMKELRKRINPPT